MADLDSYHYKTVYCKECRKRYRWADIITEYVTEIGRLTRIWKCPRLHTIER
jgi:hypothetical protein